MFLELNNWEPLHLHNMEEIRVKGRSDLVRDPLTNAIINTNTNAYEEYISRRQLKKEEVQKINELESEVASIKDDLSEIKLLLRKLVKWTQTKFH